MKKIVYIGLLFLGLVASSCSKEEIVANSNNLNSAPDWNSSARPENARPENARPESISSDDSPNEGEPIIRGTIGGGPIISFPPSDGPTGEITDPNNDPDGIKKK